jgi:hypothetical protein
MTHPEDDFDELLRRAASDYNNPRDVTRERMWGEIRAHRARQRIVESPPAAGRRLWYIPAAAAATLVLGIAIGRMYERVTAKPHEQALLPVKPESAVVVAVRPTVTDSAIHNDSGSTASAEPRSGSGSFPRASRVEPRSTPSPSTRPQRYPGSSSSMAYRLAVVEHLAGTEAMLTSFRAAAKRGDVDAQLTSWARNLLTTTRLLQASAAQEDPTMKRLLDDLELVLVQIAQYTSAGSHHAQELELIEHSIERRGVIGKLHTNIPARLGPAGT